jgi:hypothetical protein
MQRQFSIPVEISLIHNFTKAPKKELKIIRRYVLCVCVIVVVVVVVVEWGSVCQNIERSGCQGLGQTDVVLSVLFSIKCQILYAV